jgi:hypothetical protein
VSASRSALRRDLLSAQFETPVASPPTLLVERKQCVGHATGLSLPDPTGSRSLTTLLVRDQARILDATGGYEAMPLPCEARWRRHPDRTFLQWERWKAQPPDTPGGDWQ